MQNIVKLHHYILVYLFGVEVCFIAWQIKKLIFLILGLSFLVFILLGTSTEAITTSENGVLDFSNVQDLNSYNPLDGQWYFFHRELLSYNDVKTKIENNEGKLFDLPNSFENHV